jgi:hypothetical protein
MSAFKGFTPPTDDDEDMQQQAPPRPESALANELNKLNLKRQKTASPEVAQHNYAHANPIIAQADLMIPSIRVAKQFFKGLLSSRDYELQAAAQKLMGVLKPYFLLEFYYDRGDLSGLGSQMIKVGSLNSLMEAFQTADATLQNVEFKPRFQPIYILRDQLYDMLPWELFVQRNYTPSPIQRPKRGRDLQEMIYSLTV